MHKIKIFTLLGAIIAVLLMGAPFCDAAKLFVESGQSFAGPGDTLIAKIKLDNQGECLNAFDISVSFSDNLEFGDFSIGNSIISLWISKPSKADADKINQQKKFSFSGGIPGGYCGSIMGDLGESNILGEAIFKVKTSAPASARIMIESGPQVLKNDGRGTAAAVEIVNAELAISESSTSTPDQWQQRLKEDATPPEPFIIELYKDERLYDGKYVLIFSAQDKETGIDRYEVMEISQEEKDAENQESLLKKISIWRKKPAWIAAQSPYLLADQSLDSYIRVKAIDKANNERMVEYFPPEEERAKVKKVSYGPVFMLSLFLVIILPLFIIIVKIFKSRRSRQGR